MSDLARVALWKSRLTLAISALSELSLSGEKHPELYSRILALQKLITRITEQVCGRGGNLEAWLKDTSTPGDDQGALL